MMSSTIITNGVLCCVRYQTGETLESLVWVSKQDEMVSRDRCFSSMFQPSFGVEREVGFGFWRLWGASWLCGTKPSKMVARWFGKVVLPLLELYFVCMVKNDTVVEELKATHPERMLVDVSEQFFESFTAVLIPYQFSGSTAVAAPVGWNGCYNQENKDFLSRYEQAQRQVQIKPPNFDVVLFPKAETTTTAMPQHKKRIAHNHLGWNKKLTEVTEARAHNTPVRSRMKREALIDALLQLNERPAQ